MTAPVQRRVLAAVVGSVCAALTVSGCKFDGAYDLPLPGSPVDKDHAYEVTADFEDILSVVPRSPVKVDDVTVGEVTDVTRVGWHARVTLRVKDGTRLPDNAIADIRQVSLLGEKYVALEPPGGKQPTGRLSDGDKIPLSRTGRNPEVEEVLGALSFLLSGGGVGQIKIIADELNNVMDGRQDRLRHLLGELDALVGTLDDQKQDIIAALDSINNLTRTLNREKGTVTAALDSLGPAVNVLRAQHDQLITMLRQLDKLGTVGTRVIGRTKDDLIANLAHLRPILHKLNAAGQSLPRGLALLVSFPFPKEAANVVKGDFANTSIDLDYNVANILEFYGVTGPIDLQKLLDGTLENLPGLELPKTPNLPGTPQLPNTPQVPGTNKLPKTPKVAKTPKLPGLPKGSSGSSGSSGLPGLGLNGISYTGSVNRSGGFIGSGLG